MTSLQLSSILKEADGRWLSEALAALEAAPAHHRRSFRPVLIAAAVIAALLAFSVTAVAANLFGIRDLLLPEKIEIIPSAQDLPEQEPYEADAISLGGFAESPEGLAAAEWQAFLNSYDYSADSNIMYAPGTAYNYYQVYDKVMADKLDEICARHGLSLHSEWADVDSAQLFDLVGGSFHGGSGSRGYIYEDGSFLFSGGFEIPGYGELEFQMTRCVRGSFTDILLNIGDIELWQEWSLSVPDGTALSLALSPTRGLILAELSDCVIVVNVLAGAQEEPGSVFSSGPISQAELEALANSFDWSLLSPARAVDLSGFAPEDPMQRLFPNANAAYAAVLDYFLSESIFPDGTLYEPFDGVPAHYALADVNGDGAEELLLRGDNSYSAGMDCYVLSYNSDTGALSIDLIAFPALSFYEGGLVKAEASHNQGVAGDRLWPYTLFKYNTEKGEYEALAIVDAWDSGLTESYMGQSFPHEADTSGTGAVYYVMDPESYELKDPMDITEYEAWYNSYFENAGELGLFWQELSPSEK